MPEPGEWGVLKVTAVRANRFYPEEIKRLPPEYPNPSRFAIERDDLLVTRAGGNLAYVGVACVVDREPGKVMLSDKTLRLLVDETAIDKRFLMHAFSAPEVRAQVERFATGGAGQLNISQDQFRQVRIPLPLLDEQRRIANLLDAVVAASRAAERHADALDALRRALAYTTFSDSERGGLDTDAEAA
jgi:type I restriction enzyme, S subunit